MINNIKYQSMEKRLTGMSVEQLKVFLKSFSSRLKDVNLHCRDLVDTTTNIAYITSVEGSGLTVTNTSNRNMSEDVYLKAMSILGYAQNNPNSNYSEDELLFTKGYITLYHKVEAQKIH